MHGPLPFNGVNIGKIKLVKNFDVTKAYPPKSAGLKFTNWQAE